MKGQLNLTFKNGIVSGSAVEGATLSNAATWLLEAINNPDIKVNLDTVDGLYYYDSNTKNYVYFEGDAFRGSFTYNEKVTATNIVSPSVIEAIDNLTKSNKGTTMLHAALEAYIGGKYFPNSMFTVGKDGTFGKNDLPYVISHDWATCLDPTNMRDLPSTYRFKSRPIYENFIMKSDTPYIFDKSTSIILHQFETFKYR